MLTAYENQTRRLLHDPSGTYYTTTDIDAYINEGRQQIAAEGQCVRLLLSGGTIVTLTLTAPGAGYVAPVVSFSGSGQQAFATATQVGGVVQSPLTLVSGGWGWLTAPTVAITDSNGPGAGATATCTVDNSASTVATQEIYQYSTLNTLAKFTSGINQVVGVVGVACQWGSGNVYKPTLQYKIWSEFQAMYRIWSVSAMNFPAVWSMYGQGANGSFYVFPIPAQQMAMDVDTWCLPVDLATDSTPEAIPSPWTNAVQYYAAYKAFFNAQRAEDAERMFNEYERMMKRARANTESMVIPDPYGD